MARLDHWRMCSDFTVVQAALIACGEAPDDLQDTVERNPNHRPEGYVPYRTALLNALNSGRLKPAKSVFQFDYNGETTTHFDVEATTIAVEDIDRYLKSVGFVCEFFDRGAAENPSTQLSPTMPLKLRAAIQAWEAVASDPARLRGKSPKQALEAWLVENASDLGLVNRRGEPNRTGIAEICKVANWKPAGGAPSTPNQASPTTPHLQKRQLVRLPLPPQDGFSAGPRAMRDDFSHDLDDEIPF